MEIKFNDLLNFMNTLTTDESKKTEKREFIKYLKTRRKELILLLKNQNPLVNKKTIKLMCASDDTSELYLAGMAYLFGAIVRQNFIRAHYLFKACEMRNDSCGTKYLATLYLKGIGVEQSNYLYLKYLKKSIDLGEEASKEEWNEMILAYKTYNKIAD